MSDCYLTSGRTTLIERLQADATISAAVKTWHTFGPGLRDRVLVEPAYCPICAVYPASLPAPDARYNAAQDVDQELLVRVWVVGQEPDVAESIMAAAQGVIDAARADALGLSASGLKDLRLGTCNWRPQQSETAPIVIWDAALPVTLRWIRRTTT